MRNKEEYYPVRNEAYLRKQFKRASCSYDDHMLSQFGTEKFPDYTSMFLNRELMTTLAMLVVTTEEYKKEMLQWGMDGDFDDPENLRAIRKFIRSPAMWENQPKMLHGLIMQSLRDDSLIKEWHHRRWIDAGRQIYDIDDDLAEALANTRMSYPPTAIKMPYPELFLRFNSHPVHHPQTGDHEFAGAYIASPQKLFDFENVDGEGMANADIMCPDGVLRHARFHYGAIEWCNDIIPIQTVGWPHDGRPMNDDALKSEKVLTIEGEDVETTFKKGNEEYVKVTGNDADYDARLKRLRVILNALMYISSVEPDIEIRESTGFMKTGVGKKKRKKKIKFANLRAPKVYYVGHKHMAKHRHMSPVGHVRRGHWRWQPHGPKRLERKLIFIDAQWIGGREDQDSTVRVTQVNDSNG